MNYLWRKHSGEAASRESRAEISLTAMLQKPEER